MRVLVACEYSARVRDAFRARGHNAWSCDVLPCEGDPRWHYQGDVREVLAQRWDMIIAFPPCTKLSSVGARYWAKWQADGSQQEAIDFFMLFANHPVKRLAIENPAGIMSRAYRRPDQYVQPYWFGDPWTKRTGLWLRGLPKLVPTNMVEPRGCWVSGGKGGAGRTRTREGAAGNGPRAHARSLTFQGVADAMAEQWGA